MTKEVLKHWAIDRLLGLKNIPALINHLKTNKKKANDINRIEIDLDREVFSSVEVMPRAESCPYWYSTRLFCGIESYPGQHDYEEFYVGIRCTFLLPIIPIPICSDEKVFKIGFNTEIFDRCYREHNSRYYSLLLYYKDYGLEKIADNCTVHFNQTDITYKNDEVWQHTN